jgi:hypothetical protein
VPRPIPAPPPRRSPLRALAIVVIATLVGTALGFGAWWKLLGGDGNPNPPFQLPQMGK